MNVDVYYFRNMILALGKFRCYCNPQLLETLGFTLENTPTELLGDNAGSLCVANNPAAHQKTKHIRIRFHFIRQGIKMGWIKTVKAPTELQLADVLTKALAQDQYWILVDLASGNSLGNA